MAKKLGRLSIDYDHLSDVLYLSIGDHAPALTHEDREGLLIRVDPKTKKPVGATVLSYQRHFRHLQDVSWLDQTGLPAEVIDYLEERPEF